MKLFKGQIAALAESQTVGFYSIEMRLEDSKEVEFNRSFHEGSRERDIRLHDRLRLLIHSKLFFIPLIQLR